MQPCNIPVSRLYKRKPASAGFTLAELLVVTALLGLLASVILARLHTLKLRANDAVRVANLIQLRDALAQYHIDHDAYPATFPLGLPLPGCDYSFVRRGECLGNPTDYIPGLVPNYMPRLPTDPALNCAGTAHSFVYTSNGRDYKLITHVEAGRVPAMNDPVWDGGPNDYIIDGPNQVHYGVWSPDAACWIL